MSSHREHILGRGVYVAAQLEGGVTEQQDGSKHIQKGIDGLFLNAKNLNIRCESIRSKAGGEVKELNESASDAPPTSKVLMTSLNSCFHFSL